MSFDGLFSSLLYFLCYTLFFEYFPDFFRLQKTRCWWFVQEPTVVWHRNARADSRRFGWFWQRDNWEWGHRRALGQRRSPRWTYKRPKRNSLTGTEFLGTENSLKTLSNSQKYVCVHVLCISLSKISSFIQDEYISIFIKLTTNQHKNTLNSFFTIFIGTFHIKGNTQCKIEETTIY